MYSGIIVIITIVIVMDIIGKSIADKKKIEKSRMRRMKDINNRPIIIGTDSYQHEDRLEDPIREDEEYINTKQIEVPSFDIDDINLVENVEKKDIVELNKDGNTMQKKPISNKGLKNDIIKGIIYSEILSEPKSIKNIKRGI